MAIITDAVARGALQPGGVIVEGTAGDTGIGIAMVASALGYRAVIVIPDTQAQEKKDMLRLAGVGWSRSPPSPTPTPTITCAIRAAWPRRSPKRSPTARCGRTSSTTSPTGAATMKRPGRDL